MELLNPLSRYRADALYQAKDKRRSDITLTPTADPRVFRAPEVFVHTPGRLSIEVFHNGRRLIFSSSGYPSDGDFIVEESSPGGGYNEVRLVAFTPNSYSRVTGNYYVA